MASKMQRLADARALVDLTNLTPELPLQKRLTTYATVFVADHPEGTLEQFEQYVLGEMVAYFDATRRSPLQRWPRSLPRAFQEAKENMRLFKEGIFPGEMEYD